MFEIPELFSDTHRIYGYPKGFQTKQTKLKRYTMMRSSRLYKEGWTNTGHGDKANMKSLYS